MTHPTRIITCHYEDATGEHSIDVRLWREGPPGNPYWHYETDLSDVPDDEIAGVKQQAIDGYDEAPRAPRPGRRKGDKSGKHTQTQVNLRADDDEVERWTLAAARSRMDRNSFLRFAARQLADRVLGKDE